MAIKEATHQQALMLAKGMISAATAARLSGNHISTIYRWMDEGLISGEKAGGTRRYVTVTSLIAHLGPETAKTLGITMDLVAPRAEAPRG